MTRLTASPYIFSQVMADQQAFVIDDTAENTDFGLRSYPAKFGAKNYRKNPEVLVIFKGWGRHPCP